MGKHDVNTKPKLHNILHCHQRRSEPRPQITCTEDSTKFGHFVFEISEQTDRQTDTIFTILCITTGAKQTLASCYTMRNDKQGLKQKLATYPQQLLTRERSHDICSCLLLMVFLLMFVYRLGLNKRFVCHGHDVVKFQICLTYV